MGDVKYFGKYRGTVVDNLDPMLMGRLRAVVPDVSPEASAWTAICVPLAGPGMGTYFVPPIGAEVWIEFEQGDPDRPICTGGHWASPADVPPRALGPDAPIVLQTLLQHAIVLSDAPGPAGGITISSASGATIVVNDAGITISNGQGASITLTGPTVSINGGALTVD